SIALAILDLAAEEAGRRGGRVVAVHLRLGPLSGVVKEALLSAYDLAREGTDCAAAALVVEEVPVVAWCPACAAERRPAFPERCRVAALVGDLATDNDARRLARSGAPVRQITTGTVCHLEAEMVAAALDGWALDALDFLFVENVGNLVCPATFDLGEDLRLVLFSVTEGEDKPLKYPPIFHTADVALITKIDLAAAVEFDAAAAHRNIQSVRPGIPVLEGRRRRGRGW